MMENFGDFIYSKCLDFSVQITQLYSYLVDKREYVISKQILRSGTSIGANLAEAQYGVSRNDFLSKIYISLKETAETMYWLEVLKRSGALEDNYFQSLFHNCDELKRLFVSITKTTKQNMSSNPSHS